MIPHFLPKRKNSVLAIQSCCKAEKTVQVANGAYDYSPAVALGMAIQRERAGLKRQRQVTRQQSCLVVDYNRTSPRAISHLSTTEAHSTQRLTRS